MPSTSAAPAPSSAIVAQPPRKASSTEVIFRQGLLEITAVNSSLNDILRRVSHATGLRITGGVADEPVYGKYGPGLPSDILGTLLDGTGSNILYLQSTGVAPAELILTPRHGEATPPNPNAAVPGQGVSDEDTAARIRAMEPTFAPPQNAPPQPDADGSAAADPIGPGGARGAQPDYPGAPPAAVESSAPNGIRTPQQIYEQLQSLRQQQRQPAQPPPQP